MRTIFDGEFYENIDNISNRIAIINTDFTKDDPNWERMEKDVENIKKTSRKLKFADKNVHELKRSIARNAISFSSTKYCTIEDGKDPHNGYIMMFNLTYKYGCDSFRAGRTNLSSDYFRNIFVKSNLLEWSTKPKFIFYQSPWIPLPSSATETDGGVSSEISALPIDADIFEAFSNDGDEDSYGDENGSFYIQTLCDTINEHIDDQSIGDICINNIMYKVHSKVEAMVGKMGSQTLHFKSTFVKKFVFPVA